MGYTLAEKTDCTCLDNIGRMRKVRCWVHGYTYADNTYCPKCTNGECGCGGRVPDDLRRLVASLRVSGYEVIDVGEIPASEIGRMFATGFVKVKATQDEADTITSLLQKWGANLHPRDLMYRYNPVTRKSSLSIYLWDYQIWRDTSDPGWHFDGPF